MSELLRSNTLTWLLLLALTGAGFGLAQVGLNGIGVVAVVLTMTFVKGQLVIRRFMGLARVAWPWQAAMTGYLLVVLIGVAYAFAN